MISESCNTNFLISSKLEKTLLAAIVAFMPSCVDASERKLLALFQLLSLSLSTSVFFFFFLLSELHFWERKKMSSRRRWSAGKVQLKYWRSFWLCDKKWMFFAAEHTNTKRESLLLFKNNFTFNEDLYFKFDLFSHVFILFTECVRIRRLSEARRKIHVRRFRSLHHFNLKNNIDGYLTF